MNQPDSNSHVSNFIRHQIDADLDHNRYKNRRWAGKPSFGQMQKDAPFDKAAIRTRFPPEPNGYLHLGHAKSICLNFKIAQDYGGICHLRFDDTNPAKEDLSYLEPIKEAVQWLGFDWHEHLYFASSYFDAMLQAAEHLIKTNHAYVDSQNAETMRLNRGTLTEPGKNSPHRDRSIEENLTLFTQMKQGRYTDGKHVLRAKIDMGSPNINLRDPVIYRIRHLSHHSTNNKWCIYPTYTFAHPIEDALESITHSLCTLEFEDQRPFYDWLLTRLSDVGFLTNPAPRQIEFSRLNVSHTVLSKRNLNALVSEKLVEGWDDPRMPTIQGMKKRGYTPKGLRQFIHQTGVSKSDSLIEYSELEQCQRDYLNEVTNRRIAIINPLKLVIDNYPEGNEESCEAPNHPKFSERGNRTIMLSRKLWIERNDFNETPPKGYFRLAPGKKVRLRYAYVIECTHVQKNSEGEVTCVHAIYYKDSRSGTAGADQYKVKGNIHWLSIQHAVEAEVRLYDRLFDLEDPSAHIHSIEQLKETLNPHSLLVKQAKIEPFLLNATADEKFQFERLGYFVADIHDSKPGNPVFNRITDLKSTWKKK